MKIIKILLLQIIVLLISSNAVAHENKFKKINKKLDVIIANQDKQNISPLRNRRNGVELNFARLLLSTNYSTTFSGTYSRFDHRKGVEWAIPVYWGRQIDFEGQPTNVTTLDVHYRKFLGDTVKGFYISGFTRMTHINGVIGSDYDYYDEDSEEAKHGVETKFGVGVGIGYRIFSRDNIYWGMSLSVGRNIFGKNDKFIGAYFDDSELIKDLEFLKFGYSF